MCSIGVEKKELAPIPSEGSDKKDASPKVKQVVLLVSELPTLQTFLRDETIDFILLELKSGRFFWKPEIEKFALERQDHPGHVYSFLHAVMHIMRTFPKYRSVVYVSGKDKKKREVACPLFANAYEINDQRFSSIDMHRYWLYRDYDIGSLVEYSRLVIDHCNKTGAGTDVKLIHEALAVLNECLARILAIVKQKCVNSFSEFVSFRRHLLYSPATGVDPSCQAEFLRADKEVFVCMIDLYFQVECKQVVPMFHKPCGVIIKAMRELARRWNYLVCASEKHHEIQQLELPATVPFKLKVRVVTFGSLLNLNGLEYRFLQAVLTGDFCELRTITNEHTRKPDPILVSFLNHFSEFVGSVHFVRESVTIQTNTDKAKMLYAFLQNTLLSNPILFIFPKRVPFVCSVCLYTAAKLCAQCHRVRYCSSACQKLHWKSGHKSECRSYIEHKTPIEVD